MEVSSSPQPSSGGGRTLDTDFSNLQPESALAELTRLIEQQTTAGGQEISSRVEQILDLDEIAQRPARDCIACYLSETGDQQITWQAARDHAAVVHDAYGQLLAMLAQAGGLAEQRDSLALLAVRTLRTGAQLIKWEAFRHGPIASTLWPRLNVAYRLALREGIERQPVRSRMDRTTETSVEREYVRVMALQSLGLDRMDAGRLELAWCLIHHVLPLLEISSTPDETSSFWVDLASASAPMRLMHKPREAALPRYFSGKVAAKELEGLRERIASGEFPAGLPLQLHRRTEKLTAALTHIIRVWSNEAPMRRGRRHPVPGRMQVVQGLSGLLDIFHGVVSSSGHHQWTIRDTSVHGVGLAAPGGDAKALEVGMLVGLHSPQDDGWRVGTVRRLWREDSGCTQVGIELLGESPAEVTVDDGVKASQVLLLDRLESEAPVRVIVSSPGPRPGDAVFLTQRGRKVKLAPMEAVEYGVDYEMRRYLCTS